jgi:hypothetical protein
VAPKLLFIETKWASLISYGLTVQTLTDFLPLEVTLDVKTVSRYTVGLYRGVSGRLGPFTHP